MKPETNIMMAPMSGVTDLSFRLIAREHGARFCFFEMLDARALIYRKDNNIEILKTTKEDKPIAAQLLGADPCVMADAALKLTSLVDISFLDINCACPARKVIKKKAGASLLVDKKRASSMIKKIKAAIKMPVTVKMRIGYDRKDEKETEAFARSCEDAGASMLFAHGRTKRAGYSGPVDYNMIARIKTSVSIPVFGSGNVFNPTLAAKMFETTGADGILVARGACGNPWIFKSIETFAEGASGPPLPALNRRRTVLKKHLSLIERYKNISSAGKIGFMRKVSMWYLKGIPDAARARDKICRSKDQKDLLRVIASI